MFSQLTPATKNIIIINVIFFVGTFLLQNLNTDLESLLAGYFPLSPNFKSWQIITHMFMHGSILHIAFNMMTLWSFGPVLEQVLGQKKFLILYFASGLGGFALYNIWNYYEVSQITNFLTSQAYDIHEIYKYADNSYSGEMPISTNSEAVRDAAQQLFIILKTPMVGASGAIFGVIAAFSTLFPDAKLMFMFIPFPIKAKYLTPIIIVVSLFLGFRQFSGDNIAHFAHLGGALIGFLYIWSWKKNRDRIQ
ncbi:rhomboid family intramembrane serine protease [Epilithonimonas sp.]|uniref:rhomboid family intramembrane serine protease n=1 Tax=Epilithonimonas sp. TaxID=2894511 RepID=UPI0028ACB392|nr:rhomboid family intramembrane serine protease [Epilithonimonas sp.]